MNQENKVADVGIRPAYPFDTERILAWQTEESVGRYQPLGDLTLEGLRSELGATWEDLEAGEGLRFCWIVEAPRPVGWITLAVASWRHGVAEIGFSLTRAARGRGVMRQAVPKFLERLFARTALERIEARCDLRNQASIKLLETVGFRREGVLRGYFVLDGKRRDIALYALLRSEWSGR